MSDHPNILWIVVDCLRADKVFDTARGCRTPFLDEWRGRGVSFPQCISTTTTTTPSMAALLTGQWPAFNGVRSHSGFKLNPATVTLAGYLQGAGYRTLARVTGPISPEVGLDRGFDDYQWRKRREYVFGPWGETLLDELRGLHAASPWFLFLHLFELHKPRQVLPERNRDEFGRNYYERSLSSLDPMLQRIVEAAGAETVVLLTGDHGERLLPTARQEDWYDRFQPIRKPLRKLIFRLKRNPVSGAFYETGHGFHVYDELVRVPLVCVGPGFPAGRVIGRQVRHVDLAPTILELAGAAPESLSMNGRSLLSLVRDEESEDRPAYCEAVGAALPNARSWLAGIRTPETKYCYRPFAERPFEELYDLRTDPGERRNLAPGRPGLCAEWRAKLQALSREFEAQPILQGQKMSAEEQQILEERLKDLGYIE
jgi:arylsulfatase A-like enzyme